jgi:hypothetical protein
VTDYLLQAKEFYWAHRDVCRIGFAAAAIVLFQTALLVVVLRRLGEIAHLRERLSRLADGLALLTDTTESGLSSLVREVQQRAKKPARASGRASVSKRISTAAREGTDIGDIALSEALTESEVRLHLSLAEAAARHTAAQPAAR